MQGKDLVAVQQDDFGHFFAGDSYVILYTYTLKRKEEYIIYTWQGLDSTKDEVSNSMHVVEDVMLFPRCK